MTVTHSTLISHHGGSGEALIRSGLLQLDGEENSIVAADEDDAPIYEVIVDPLRQQLGYRNAIGAWVPVEKTSLHCYRINIESMLVALLGDQLRRPVGGLSVIEPEWIWEAGRLHLVRTAPTDIWFARRLSDRHRLDALKEAADRLPTRSRRIVLTSTPRHRLPKELMRNTSIVPVADVLDSYSPFSIDHGRLLAMSLGKSVLNTDPVHLSEDGSTLTILGTEISFGGKHQREAVRLIVDAYKTGRRVNAAQTLEKAGFGSGVRLFRHAFRKQWPVLKQFLKSRDELWRIEL